MKQVEDFAGQILRRGVRSAEQRIEVQITSLEALQHTDRLDLALLPAESVNDDGLFIDDVSFEEVAGSIDAPVLLSAHFTDALASAPAT